MTQPAEALGVDHQQAFYQEVGRRIRDARKRHTPPLTQEGLASLVSLTRTSITNIEKGRQKLLLHTLADIARAIHLSPSELLPNVDGRADRHLDDVLKHQSSDEKAWIRAAVTAAQKGEK